MTLKVYIMFGIVVIITDDMVIFNDLIKKKNLIAFLTTSSLKIHSIHGHLVESNMPNKVSNGVIILLNNNIFKCRELILRTVVAIKWNKLFVIKKNLIMISMSHRGLS